MSRDKLLRIAFYACLAGLGYHWALRDLIILVLSIALPEAYDLVKELPNFNEEQLMALLLATLGIGGVDAKRIMDKKKEEASNG